MPDVPAYLALGGYPDHVARAQGGVWVGDEVALVGLEVLRKGGGGIGVSGCDWSGAERSGELMGWSGMRGVRCGADLGGKEGGGEKGALPF